MELNRPPFALFAGELPPAQQGKMNGIAQRALRAAGIEMAPDEQRSHLEVISCEQYDHLPGIADARRRMQDALTEYCTGQPQTEV